MSMHETVRRISQVDKRLSGLERRETSGGRVAGVFSAYLALPGLRGFWPMSAFDSSGNALDVSGNGRTLTYNGNPVYNVDGLAPYLDLDGTGDFLSRTDEAGLDISGTESYVSGVQGLTIGCWVYNQGSASRILMGKIGTLASHQAYFLTADGSDSSMDFDIVGPSSSKGMTATGATINTWIMVVGRFVPGSEMSIFINTTETIETSSIPASVKNTAGDFAIGAKTDGSSALDARVSMAFLCAAALPDAVIEELYRVSRGLFGV